MVMKKYWTHSVDQCCLQVWQFWGHLIDLLSILLRYNGFIELLDAFRVLQYDVGFRNFSKAEMLAADVSGDGTVNIADALLIQEFDAGLITEF